MARIFISYDFADKEKFDDLAHAFADKNIPIFDPRSMVGTRALADQLREAIRSCEACVFVATHQSVVSAWCGAELGAFWGAGKSVVIYVADTSLVEEQLPKQFAGWLLVRSLFKVVSDIEALLAAAGSKALPTEASLAALTVEGFKAVVVEALEGVRQRSDVADVIFQLGGDFDYDADEERFKRLAGRGLTRLLGEVLPKALEMRVQGWRYTFDAPTSTGVWLGYGQVAEEGLANGMLQLYRKCLLLRLDEHRRVVGAALVLVVTLSE